MPLFHIWAEGVEPTTIFVKEEDYAALGDMAVLDVAINVMFNNSPVGSRIVRRIGRNYRDEQWVLKFIRTHLKWRQIEVNKHRSGT